mgnify:CR=1 FL=1
MCIRDRFQSMSNTKQTKPVQKSESFTETRRKSSSSSTSSNSARTESVAQRKPHSARQDSHPAPDSKAQGKPHPARPDPHQAPVKRDSHETKRSSSISKSGSVSDSRPPSLSDSSSISKHVAVPPETQPHLPHGVAEPLAAAQTHSTEGHPHHASVHSSHTPSYSASSHGSNGRDAPSVSPGDMVKGGSPYKVSQRLSLQSTGLYQYMRLSWLYGFLYFCWNMLLNFWQWFTFKGNVLEAELIIVVSVKKLDL